MFRKAAIGACLYMYSCGISVYSIKLFNLEVPENRKGPLYYPEQAGRGDIQMG
jgi:hypothetical protein